MQDTPRLKLREIVNEYGVWLLDDPRRCRALLMDYCGEYKGEINLLYLALHEKIARELRSASPYLPKGLLYGRLTRHLQDAYFFTEDVARWAVESCAYALDMPEANPELRVFKSKQSTTLMVRSWSSSSREWSELGSTPGKIEEYNSPEVLKAACVLISWRMDGVPSISVTSL